MPRRARDPWVRWLAAQPYSAWESARVPHDGRGTMRRPGWKPDAVGETFQLPWVREGGARPAPAWIEAEAGSARAGWLCDRVVEDARGAWRTSHRLDSADFGNGTLYCAIGAYGVEERPDLSRVIKLCGPRKRDIPLSPPHYDLPGGFEYRAIDATRLVLYGIATRGPGGGSARLFRSFPRQRQRRVLGTPIVVTTVEDDGLRVTMVDFAPRGPDLAMACRVFVAENVGRVPLEGVVVHQFLVSSRGSWTVTRVAGGVQADDGVDGTGVRLVSPFAGPAAAPALLDAEPEAGWQRVEAPLVLPPLPPGAAASAWSLLLPRIAGGDPDQDAAEAAAERFDPVAALDATLAAWRAWSAGVRLSGDRPVVTGLVDGLQVLLKTHEGERGLHLGTTYQRHTHSWARDNYLMHRGLLAVGRIPEARHNLEGFVACWRQSGIACGYNVFTRASWIPRPTPELCSYLVLMARDVHLWTGEPPQGSAWDMVADCADTLALNARGLVGFDGDEIWFWELDPRMFALPGGGDLRSPETLASFCVLDNCWLAQAALEYAERAAAARGEASRALAWRAKRERLEAALETELWDERRGTYSALLFPDGRAWDGPLVSGYCTPSYFGVPERHPGSWRAMAAECGKTLMTAEGVVRGNAATHVYAGMTPPFYLHALGSAGARDEGDRYFEALLRALPSSGATWEYGVIDMPWTGTDKRRGGDSGVLLAAVMDYCVGLRPTWDGLVLRPHLPRSCGRIAVKGLSVRGKPLAVDIGPRGARVTIGDAAPVRVPAGSEMEWNATAGSVDVRPPAPRGQGEEPP